MRTLQINLWAVFLSAAFLAVSSCSSPSKLVDTGDYDQAIQLAIQRLAGKKEKKEIYVQVLEEAFAKVTARDMEAADRFKASGRPEDWEKVYEI